MIDLAVGMIIGTAFNGIVKSLVDDMFMPVLSLFTGKLDFANWFIALDGNKYLTIEAAKEAGAATLNYGNFISGVINFIVMAFVVFMIVKFMNSLKKDEPAPAPAAPTTKKCPFCKTDIALDATRCPHCTSTLE
jgi:large conductance mechanosensitive channel